MPKFEESVLSEPQHGDHKITKHVLYKVSLIRAVPTRSITHVSCLRIASCISPHRYRTFLVKLNNADHPHMFPTSLGWLISFVVVRIIPLPMLVYVTPFLHQRPRKD